MAKKKASSTSRGKSTAVKKSATPKTAAKQKSSSPSSTAKSGKPQATLDSEVIGITAGEVWGVLSDKGEVTLAALKKELDASGDLVTAAIGWLAREEKLQFSAAGRSVKIGLK